MSVRFKFRSSVGFDSVDLGRRSSISVRDLRARIVEQKNLTICRDFDLVISDAETGEAYDDEEFMIPEGSSVIIKRVPAVSGAIRAAENSATKHLSTLVPSPSQNVDLNNFDDFGNDLYPTLDASLPNSDADAGNSNLSAKFDADAAPRCCETFLSRWQNLESNLSEGSCAENCDITSNIHENDNQTKWVCKMEEHKKVDRNDDVPSPTMINTDLPMELKCSLCNMIFKDAVMIPCCQHSFCDKCIRLALSEKVSCPKCSSTKCGVDDLLPNLSLRQAIEHFPESQIPNSGSDKIIPKYAPDGESGIQASQAKDVSCAVSCYKQEPPLPDSPTATGKGSNQVMTDSAYDTMIKKKRLSVATGSQLIHLDAYKSVKSGPPGMKQKQADNEYIMPKDLKYAGDSQGVDQKLLQNLAQKDEVNVVTKKKKGLFAHVPDVGGSAVPSSRHKKGERNCYMCGSPDHLVRDCPAASNPYPILQNGDPMFAGNLSAYGQHYWPGSSFPHVRPYANLYGTSGMMPFDPSMVPVTPFAVPSYMPSIYPGLSVPCGYMRMGAVAPTRISGADCPPTYAEVMELQDNERKHRLLNEHLERGQPNTDDDFAEDYRYNDTRRKSHDYRNELDINSSKSYSGHESPRLHKRYPRNRNSYSPRRCGSDFPSDEEIRSGDHKYVKRTHSSTSRRDHRGHYSERAGSEIQDASDSSNRHGKERRKHRHKSSSIKHKERGQGSDCSRKSHYKSRKDTTVYREMAVINHRKHTSKHATNIDSPLDPGSSGHRKKQKRKEKELNSKDKDISSDDQLVDDRWEMMDAPQDSFREEYHRHKRKRH